MRDEVLDTQNNTTPAATAHALNNKIGIILARCDLLEIHSQLNRQGNEDLHSIREAAEALAAMVRKGTPLLQTSRPKQ